MEVTGMLYGAKLLQFAGFPTAEVLGPDASEEEIKRLIEKHGSVFVKPVFKGGVGKKGKSGLIGRASDLKTALKEKERLYFVEHRVGNTVAKANGVTFEGAVPAEHEVYFSIAEFDALSGADDDPDASGRGRYRGARSERTSPGSRSIR